MATVAKTDLDLYNEEQKRIKEQIEQKLDDNPIEKGHIGLPIRIVVKDDRRSIFHDNPSQRPDCECTNRSEYDKIAEILVRASQRVLINRVHQLLVSALVAKSHHGNSSSSVSKKRS